MEMKLPRSTLSVVEAAEILGIGRNSAYEAAGRGEIPVIRIGRLLRVPRAALERMLDEAGQHKPVAVTARGGPVEAA